MVSPYLSRPLRSLREALESGRTPPQRRPESAAARPEAADSLTPPLAPRRPFTVVTGGGPGPSRGSGDA